MKDVLPTPVSVQVAGGFVAPSDRGYASEVVDSLCGPSRSARGRVVLVTHRYADGSNAASADAILVIDEYRLLCAGAIATTMREAIEELETRLQRQLGNLRAHEHALTHTNRRAVGTVRRSHQRPRTPVSS
jgi:hypothetical protein